MKKWQQQIRGWMANYLELPSDVMLDLPRVTTIGDFHVYIENHNGLMHFSEQEIRLKSRKGIIKLTGEGFVLKLMLSEEILVEGNVQAVQFITD
ncbi:sporulation protein YqfC [Thalassobacillus pellis]|uniref:sporulation protein YqfC n=1 Tax=Thalassobacillus pellis TaxID=748008 RepID=UPI00195F8B55|nr:sporulation protein YqfC [Thalassobacillus pellis]MBM7554726.1 sporulation protein YqfC [Thalassobacillus pellis]